MKNPINLQERRVAAVTIDLHRGHLDPAVATMPVSPEKAAEITKANAVFLQRLRAARVPVIHVMTSYRNTDEIAGNPWWRSVAGTNATRARVLEHQVAGSPGLEIMPEVLERKDLLVTTKKRYDCFIATDLDHVLRSLKIDTLLLTGINTNSCVLATAVAGNVRDYAVVVVRDCVATMDDAMHEPALAIVDAAFGWTMTSEEVMAAL